MFEQWEIKPGLIRTAELNTAARVGARLRPAVSPPNNGACRFLVKSHKSSQRDVSAQETCNHLHGELSSKAQNRPRPKGVGERGSHQVDTAAGVMERDTLGRSSTLHIWGKLEDSGLSIK